MGAVVDITARLQAQGLDQFATDVQRKLRGLSATVDIDTAGSTGNLARLNSGLTATQATLRRVQSQANATNAAFSNAISRIQASAGALENFSIQAGLAARRFIAFSVAAGSVIKLTQAIRDGFRAAVDFDLAMNKLAQVSGATSSQIADARNEIFQLSTSLGVSSKALADVRIQLAQAGLKGKELSEALRVVALTDLAPNFDSMKQSTEGVIASWRQFKLEAKDLESAFGGINAVAGEFAVEASDLVAAIQRAGGSFAAVAGNAKQGTQALSEFLGLFTSIRATTRESAETIATGLRTIFTRLQRPETVQRLKELGIELRYVSDEARDLGNANLEGQFVGAYEAVRRLSEGLSGLRETDSRFSSTLETLGGYRQISKVLPLLKQFEESEKAINVALAGQISLQIAQEKRQESLLNKATKVKEEYLSLAQKLVDSKGFQSLADSLLKIGSGFADVLKFAGPLLPVLGALGAVKLGAGIGPALLGFGKTFAAPVGSSVTTPVRRYARGGVVPGVGDTDSHPAMLMPGEYVIRKKAAKAIGYDKLHAMNAGHYANGGTAHRQISFYQMGSDAFNEPLYAKRPIDKNEARNIGRLNKEIASYGGLRNDSVVYRGIGPEEQRAILAQLGASRFKKAIGRTFVTPQFLSTSFDQDKAESFGSPVLRIRVPKGAKGFPFKDVGVKTAENEVLFSPRRRMQIQNVSDDGVIDVQMLAKGGTVKSPFRVNAASVSSILRDISDETGIDVWQLIRSVKIKDNLQSKYQNIAAKQGRKSVKHGAYLHADDDDSDRRGMIRLSRSSIKSEADLRYVLAHELGHAADNYLGGDDLASRKAGSKANSYGRFRGSLLRKTDAKRGRSFAKPIADYRYSAVEGFAEAFADSVLGRREYEGFERNILSALPTRKEKPRGGGFFSRIGGFFGRVGSALRNEFRFATGGRVTPSDKLRQALLDNWFGDALSDDEILATLGRGPARFKNATQWQESTKYKDYTNNLASLFESETDVNVRREIAGLLGRAGVKLERLPDGLKERYGFTQEQADERLNLRWIAPIKVGSDVIHFSPGNTNKASVNRLKRFANGGAAAVRQGGLGSLGLTYDKVRGMDGDLPGRLYDAHESFVRSTSKKLFNTAGGRSVGVSGLTHYPFGSYFGLDDRSINIDPSRALTTDAIRHVLGHELGHAASSFADATKLKSFNKFSRQYASLLKSLSTGSSSDRKRLKYRLAPDEMIAEFFGAGLTNTLAGLGNESQAISGSLLRGTPHLSDESSKLIQRLGLKRFADGGSLVSKVRSSGFGSLGINMNLLKQQNAPLFDQLDAAHTEFVETTGRKYFELLNGHNVTRNLTFNHNGSSGSAKTGVHGGVNLNPKGLFDEAMVRHVLAHELGHIIHLTNDFSKPSLRKVVPEAYDSFANKISSFYQNSLLATPPNHLDDVKKSIAYRLKPKELSADLIASRLTGSIYRPYPNKVLPVSVLGDLAHQEQVDAIIKKFGAKKLAQGGALEAASTSISEDDLIRQVMAGGRNEYASLIASGIRGSGANRFIPSGSNFLGHGLVAAAFRSPQGDVFRVQPFVGQRPFKTDVYRGRQYDASLFSYDRPPIEPVLQNTGSVLENSTFIERLPFVPSIADVRRQRHDSLARYSPSLHSDLVKRLAAAGYRYPDIHTGNVGFHNGVLKVVDPGSLHKISQEELLAAQMTTAQFAPIGSQSTTRRRGFATGGTAGKDSIPALLMPGEYVINAPSARRLGLANLEYMNKTGRVRKFAKGGKADKGPPLLETPPNTHAFEFGDYENNPSIAQAVAAEAAKLKIAVSKSTKVFLELTEAGPVFHSFVDEVKKASAASKEQKSGAGTAFTGIQEQLIAKNIPLVEKLVRKYTNGRDTTGEVYDVGIKSLMQAVRTHEGPPEEFKPGTFLADAIMSKAGNLAKRSDKRKRDAGAVDEQLPAGSLPPDLQSIRNEALSRFKQAFGEHVELPTRFQDLQKFAKSVGVKGSGTADDISQRIADEIDRRITQQAKAKAEADAAKTKVVEPKKEGGLGPSAGLNKSDPGAVWYQEQVVSAVTARDKNPLFFNPPTSRLERQLEKRGLLEKYRAGKLASGIPSQPQSSNKYEEIEQKRILRQAGIIPFAPFDPTLPPKEEIKERKPKTEKYDGLPDVFDSFSFTPDKVKGPKTLGLPTWNTTEPVPVPSRYTRVADKRYLRNKDFKPLEFADDVERRRDAEEGRRQAELVSRTIRNRQLAGQGGTFDVFAARSALLGQVSAGELGADDAFGRIGHKLSPAQQATFRRQLEHATGGVSETLAQVDKDGNFVGGSVLNRAQRQASVQIAARGGEALVSQTSKDRIAEGALRRQLADTERELYYAQRNLLKQIYPQIRGIELHRKATEDVAAAMTGQARVVRNGSGRLVGLADTVRLAGGVQAAPGASGLRYQLGSAFSSAREGLSNLNQGIANSRLGRFFEGRGSTFAFLGAPLLADQIEQFGGTAEHAVASGSSGRFTGSRAIAGGLQSAVAFGAAGSVFGPLGTAVGALTGSIYGTISAFKEAEKEIRQVKINNALTTFTDRVGQLAGLGPVADVSVLGQARSSLTTFQTETAEKNRREATGFFSGFNAQTFSELQRRSQRQELGAQLPSITQYLQRNAENLGKRGIDSSVDTLVSQLQNGGEGLNREFLQIIADLRGLTIPQVLKEFREGIVRGQRDATRERNAIAGSRADERNVNTFNRLLLAVQSAADSLTGLRQKAQALNDVFDGSINASRISLGAESLDNLGRLDRGSISPLRTIAAAGGEIGGHLLETGTQIDEISRVLPGVLATAVRNSPADPQHNPIIEIMRSLRTALGGETPANRGILASLQRRLDEETKNGPGSLYQNVETDTSAFVQRLLSGQTEPIKEFGTRIAKLLEEESNKFIEGLSSLAGRLRQVGESQDLLSNIRVSSYRQQLEFQSVTGGRQVLDRASLDRLEGGFNERQARLGGSVAFSPEGLASQLAETRRNLSGAVERQQSLAEQGGRSAEFAAAAEEVTRLKSRAADLQAALRNLADVSTRNAAIQEKLNRLQQEREGRLGLAERYATASPEESVRLNRGFLLANQAANAGNLDNFASDDRRLIIETLRAAGSTTLTGFRGGPRADDLLNRLLGQSFGGFGQLNTQQLAEERQLQQTVSERFKVAEDAVTRLISFQTDSTSEFHANLTRQHEQFFSRLEGLLGREALNSSTNRYNSLSATQREQGIQSGHRDLLASFGVTTTAQVTALKERQTDVDNLVNGIEASRRARQTAGNLLRAVDNPNFVENSGLQIENAGRNDIRGRNQEAIERFASANGATAPVAGSIAVNFDRILRERFNRGVRQDEVRGVFGESFRAAVSQAVTGPNNSPLAAANAQIQGATANLQNIRGLNVNGLRDSIEARGDRGRQAILDALAAFDRTNNTLEGLNSRIQNTRTELEQLTRTIAALRERVGEAGPVRAPGFANGGAIGGPRGTDTVPAWLTPGEFVVRREVAQAHLPLLKQLNSGKGPLYRAKGGGIPKLDDPDGFFNEPESFDPDAPPADNPIKVGGLLNKNANRLIGEGATAAPNPDVPNGEDVRRNAARLIDQGAAVAPNLPALPNPDDAFRRQQNDIEAQLAFQARTNPFGASALLRGRRQANDFIKQQQLRAAARQDAIAGRQFDLARRNGDFRDFMAGLPARLGRQQTQEAERRRFISNTVGRFGFAGQVNAFNQRSLFSRSIRPGDEGQRSIAGSLAAQTGRYNYDNVRRDPNFGDFLNRNTRSQTIGARPLAFATGGMVPDSIPAMLTPGEFVLNRSAVQRAGASNLQRFNSGGAVGGGSGFGGGAEGSPELAAAMRSFGTSADKLVQGITSFSGSSAALADAISKMPRTLTMNATHQVNVVLNGAEVLGKITPEIKSMVVDEVKKSLGRIFKEQLPDAGVQV